MIVLRVCRPLMLVVAGVLASASAQPSNPRVELTLNVEESDAVLALIARKQSGRAIEDRDWERLFATEPYVRLKRREADMQRTFSDDAFKRFVLSDELSARAPELERTLRAWQTADLQAAAARALAYLPAGARIRAKVFPVIKPQSNSFVYELRTDPAIFLYLDPGLDAAQFENTVAHELHHVGYSSVDAAFDASVAGLPAQARAAAEWMGAFGEGFAMLAAAGGPDVHPHAASPQDDRERWDRDLARLGEHMHALEAFFLDVIAGKITDGRIQQAGMAFFGVQGPWYTVGWKMAAIIEQRFGRAALIECMQDPRKLLATYNRAASELARAGGERLPQWSPELLRAVDPQP